MYSHDSGRTWQVAGTDLDSQAGQGMSLDLQYIPGCARQCRIRVLASDNINQTAVTSPAFSKTGLPPLANITRPHSVDVYPYGQHINLKALVTDREDGSLPPKNLTWHSDLDGKIGIGAGITLFDASPGLHTITLTARDSDGMKSIDTVGVFVFSLDGGKTFLPVVAANQEN